MEHRSIQKKVKTTKNNFQKENDELLKFILNQRFFGPWRNPKEELSSLSSTAILEIYLSANCNQKCNYCYLYNNKKLYPIEIDKPDLIIKNLEIFYNYLIKNKYQIPSIEFFSGEIWYNDFGLQVLETTYNALLKGLSCNRFMIPSNCSFLMNNSQTQKIQSWIDKYKKLGVSLLFSISVDGAVIENNVRPLNSKINKEEDFYYKLFNFAKHNDFYFHPMVSYYNIDKWVENYQWWEKQCEEYNLDITKHVMFLEVRNDGWTKESIQHYNNLLNEMIDYEINHVYNGNAHEFIYDFFKIGKSMEEPIKKEYQGYIPFSFSRKETFPGCSISTHLTVRMGDLAICPCHRLSYNHDLYGHFITENDEIVDIKSNNFYLANKILLSNDRLTNIKCDTCKFSEYCLYGCYGSQKEINNDPFIPIESVCLLFEEKFKFLIKKFKEMGAYDILKSVTPYSPNYIYIAHLINFMDNILQDEKNG